LNRDNNKPFAEVIESSLNRFLAQSWKWDTFPIFGSLVQIKGKAQTILGCVTAVKTGSMDPLRYPFPYQKSEETLKEELPQIFEFLKTTFTVTILGYQDKNKLHYTLPPTPAKIHAFVCNSPSQLSTAFFSSPNFLHLLFASQGEISHFDDLLLAIFRQKKLSSADLNDFCNKFSLLTGNDYRRLKLFLQRVDINCSK
jgi:hypothetical protein